jgi:HSP20 family protein
MIFHLKNVTKAVFCSKMVWNGICKSPFERSNLKEGKEVTMNLINWTKKIKQRFPKLVENFMGRKIDVHASDTEEMGMVPFVNILDKGKYFEVHVGAPGLNKEDINLEIRNAHLIISSEKKYENEESNGQWMRREFGYASFQRVFQLPQNADPDQIDASLKNGILKIKIGKNKRQANSKILISVQ